MALALKPWVRVRAYCELNPYGQGVLMSRMSEGELDVAPIWDDVRTLQRHHLPRIDIISGGFPCQDISIAGRGQGLEGERSGLFREVARLAYELRPRFLFLENVPAITSRGGCEVVGTLASLGYDARWTIVSARDVGANHLRERWFLLAYAIGERRDGRESDRAEGHIQTDTQRNASPLQPGRAQRKLEPRPLGSVLSHADRARPSQREKAKTEHNTLANIERQRWWDVEPDVVEWLMGFRTGWTELAPWVTLSSRSRAGRRLKFLPDCHETC